MSVTYIYWLFDRSVPGWARGEPFYCGKTRNPPHKRLQQHIRESYWSWNRLKSERIAAAGKHLDMEIMAVVPEGGDWGTVEARWIAMLRHINPTGAVNISSGQGSFGEPRPAAVRAEISRRMKEIWRGRKRPKKKKRATFKSKREIAEEMRIRAKYRTEQAKLLSVPFKTRMKAIDTIE